jgi:hypothetical protein
MDETEGASGPGRAVRLRYALLGLAVGGIWLWGGSSPLWLHALRTAVVLLTLPVAGGRIADSVARRTGRARTFSVRRLATAKAVLILIAIAVTATAGNRVAHLDLYIAAWMAITLAVGGPAVHHRLLIRAPGDISDR